MRERNEALDCRVAMRAISRSVRRGVEGVLEPVWYNGKIVGHRRRYSDVMLIFMLKARRPGTFRDNATIEHSGHGGAPLDFTVSFVSPKAK